MNRKSTIILTIMFIILIIPILIIGQYNHPSADDYNYSVATHNVWEDTQSFTSVIVKAFEESYERMYNWQGLYASGVILALQPAIYGEQYYILASYLLLAFFIMAIFGLLWNVVGNIKLVLPFALAIMLLNTQYLPDATEGFFWFNGAYNYTFFFILLLFECCGFLLFYKRKSAKYNIALCFALCFLSFTISGGNHVTAFEQLMLLAIICLYLGLSKQRKKIIYFGLILFVAIFGFLINIFAPGTAIRQSYFVDRPNIVVTVIKSLAITIKYVGEWITIPYISLLLLTLPCAYAISKRIFKTKQIKLQHLLFIIVFFYLFLSVLSCLPYYAMGFGGDGRLINIIYFNFIIMSFVIEVFICSYISKYITNELYIKIRELRIPYLAFCTILLLLGFIGTRSNLNAYRACKSLFFGEAQQYSREIEMRLDMVKGNKAEQMEVPALTVFPSLLYFDDITEDEFNWKNDSYAQYYGLKSIKIRNYSDNIR